MTEPSNTLDWSSDGGTNVSAPPEAPGYEILAELGRGGMGVVYKARQYPLNRLVAIKFLRDAVLAGPQERARFRTEAAAAARLNHPHLVSVFEVGEHRGLQFFTMELLEGGGLDRRLRSHPLSIRESAELIRTLALAIQHAHDASIVHRDLKPANILFGPAGPKIADFGLAKRLDSDSTGWTRNGAVLGTAGYMAPEQAAGHASEVGPTADVYSLGAILYELIARRPPFQGDGWAKIIDQVLYDEPTPPSRLQRRLAFRSGRHLFEMSRESAGSPIRPRGRTGGRVDAISRRQTAGGETDRRRRAVGSLGRGRRIRTRRRDRPRPARRRLPCDGAAVQSGGGRQGLRRGG